MESWRLAVVLCLYWPHPTEASLGYQFIQSWGCTPGWSMGLYSWNHLNTSWILESKGANFKEGISLVWGLPSTAPFLSVGSVFSLCDSYQPLLLFPPKVAIWIWLLDKHRTHYPNICTRSISTMLGYWHFSLSSHCCLKKKSGTFNKRPLSCWQCC